MEQEDITIKRICNLLDYKEEEIKLIFKQKSIETIRLMMNQ